MEDEMRVLLGHGANVRDIVTHHHIGQREVRGGPMWQVAHDEAVWHSAGLVHQDKVSDVVGAACIQQLLHLVVATVDTLAVRQDQAHLLHNQSAR